MNYPQIYKTDVNGNIRVWWIESDGQRYRTHSGVLDGQMVCTGWTTVEPTNVGRANERNIEQQCAFEIDAAYEHKLTREYHHTIEKARANGAHYFKPMLAHKYETFQPGFAQPKFDGVRCIARAEGLFSRQGKPILACSHIHEALGVAFDEDPDAVFDGELYNHEFKDDFNKIISLVRKQNPTASELSEIQDLVQYQVYDVPSRAGGFGERFFELLDGCVWQNPALHIVDTRRVDTAEEYDDLHEEWLEEGYEGSIWRADAPYEQKRSKHLLKRKEFIDQEFACVRIEEGNGNWAGLAKRVVCRLPDGREFGAGIKGNQARAKELLNEDHSVVTVQYFQLTPDGIPRFPVVTKFHGAERDL